MKLSFNDAIKNLSTFKVRADIGKTIANIMETLEILAETEKQSTFTTKLVERSRKELNKILTEAIFNKDETLIQATHYALLVLAEFAPINEEDSDLHMPIDPITFSAIEPDDRVVISTGRAFSLSALKQFHETRPYKGRELGETDKSKWLIDPVTNLLFSVRDTAYIQTMANIPNLKTEAAIPANLKSIINTEQFLLLSNKFSQFLKETDNIIKILMEDWNVSLKQLYQIGADELKKLFLFPKELNFLVKEAKVSIPEILALNLEERDEVIKKRKEVALFLDLTKIPLGEFISIGKEVRENVYHDTFGIAHLITRGGIVLTDFAQLGTDVRKDIVTLNGCDNLLTLNKQTGVQIKEILNLSPMVLKKLCHMSGGMYSGEITELCDFCHDERAISFEDLLKQDEEIQLELLADIEKLRHIIVGFNITLVHFFETCSKEKREEFIKNSHALCNIHIRGKIPFDVLAQFEINVIGKLAEHQDRFIFLLNNQNIDLDKLQQLSVEQWDIILNEKKSKESEEILKALAVEDETAKALPVYWDPLDINISYLMEKTGVTLEQLQGLEGAVQATLRKNSNDFFFLIDIINLSDFFKLEPDFQIEVINNARAIDALVSAEIKLKMLLELNSALRMKLFEHHGDAESLFKVIKFHEFLKFNSEKQMMILENAADIRILLKEGFGLSEIFDWDPTQRAEILKNADSICGLIKAGSNLPELLNLNPDMRKEVFENAGDISNLIKLGVKLDAIFALDKEFRQQVVDKTFEVERLLATRKINWQGILAYEGNERNKLLNEGDAIADLLKANIALKAIFNLKEPLQSHVIRHSSNVCKFLKQSEWYFHQLINIQPDELRDLLIQYSWCLTDRLCKFYKAPLESFFELKPEALISIIKNYEAAGSMALMGNVTFEQLKRLSVDQLNVVLKDYTSTESAKILQSVSGKVDQDLVFPRTNTANKQ